ncbi:MAG TPA: hypothetical protein PK299_06585 [Anaerolineales bacterium]|nr:hypothetical protein [Anaerolineales bacterium]
MITYLETMIVNAARVSSGWALFGLVICGALLMMFRERRVLLLSFIVQVVLVGLFFAQIVPPRLAIVKVIVGILVATVYAVTIRQLRYKPTRLIEADSIIETDTTQLPAIKISDLQLPELEATKPKRDHGSTFSGVLFRGLASLLVLLIAWQIVNNTTFPFPNIDQPILLATFFLIGMGVLMIGLTEEALKTGMGLFSILWGFQIFYTAVEPSLAVFAFLAGLDLMLALSISYLAITGEQDAEKTESTYAN